MSFNYLTSNSIEFSDYTSVDSSELKTTVNSTVSRHLCYQNRCIKLSASGVSFKVRRHGIGKVVSHESVE